MTTSFSATLPFAEHDLQNCLVHAFRQGLYPQATWQEFLRNYGITERYQGKPVD